MLLPTDYEIDFFPKRRELFRDKSSDSYPVHGLRRGLGMRMGMFAGGGALPKAYKEVTCLISSGKQYINTGINPTANTCWGIDLAYTGVVTSEAQNANGAYKSGKYFRIYISSSSSTPTSILAGMGSFVSTSFEFNKRYRFVLDSYNSTIKINDNTYATTAFSPDTYNLILFAQTNSLGSVAGFCKMKLFESYCKESGVATRKFVPCYRVSDNVGGLYDTVTKTFFGNGGSGKFGYQKTDGTVISPT